MDVACGGREMVEIAGHVVGENGGDDMGRVCGEDIPAQRRECEAEEQG